MEKKTNEQRTRSRGERIFTLALTAAVLAACLLVNVLLYVINLRTSSLYIIPNERDLTLLSGASDELFSDAVEKGARVKISFCMAEDELQVNPMGSLVYKTATEFQKKYPELIELDYINVLRMVNKDGKPVDLKRFTDAGNEIRKHSVIFECGEKFRVLTDVNTSTGFVDFYTTNADGSVISYDGELVIAGMIGNVLRNETKRAYLTVGHTEQIDPVFSKLLILSGYESETLDLSSTPVPEDCELLIVSAPRNDFETSDESSEVPFSVTEAGRLEAYLKRGGNLYVALDPYVKKLPVLEGILAECGISLSETDLDGTLVRDLVKDRANAITTDGYSISCEFAEGESAEAIRALVEKHSDDRVILRFGSALRLDKGAEALLCSSDSAVCENASVTTREDGPFAVSAYNRIAIDGSDKEATVFVTGSIYLTVSSAVVADGYSNRDYVFAVFEQLYGLDSLPYGTRSVAYDTSSLEDLTMSTATLYTVLAFIAPVAAACVGAVVLIKRKNR